MVSTRIVCFSKTPAKYFDEEAHPDMTREFLPLFAEALPPISHSPVVISMCTLLEQEIRGCAAALLSALGSELKFGEFSGGVLERFRLVAVKIAGLQLEEWLESWQDNIGIFEIRNCLVHSDGDLSNFQKPQVIRAFSNGTQRQSVRTTRF